MKTPPFDIGFRVVGHKAARRRVDPARRRLRRLCRVRPPSGDRPRSLPELISSSTAPSPSTWSGTAREAGYNGPCGASWLWWDVDRPDDLGAALSDARRLAGAILDRYRELDEDDLLIFLSGGKGVHVGHPDRLAPRALARLPRRREAVLPRPGGSGRGRRRWHDLLEDPALPAPNSRHPKTGLFKRRLSLDELMHLKPEAIVELARQPEPFDIPTGPAICVRSGRRLEQGQASRSSVGPNDQRAAPRDGSAKLTAFARRFIRDGELDERSGKSRPSGPPPNSAEFYLSHGFERLLTPCSTRPPSTRGLTPSEARHAIDGGLRHARRQREGGAGMSEARLPIRRRPARRLAGRRPAAARRRPSIRSGRASWPGIEIGPGLVTLIGGAPGQGKTALDDATGARRPGAHARACGPWSATSRCARASCSTASLPGSPTST